VSECKHSLDSLGLFQEIQSHLDWLSAKLFFNVSQGSFKRKPEVDFLESRSSRGVWLKLGYLSNISVPLLNALFKSLQERKVVDFSVKVFYLHLPTLGGALFKNDSDITVNQQLNLWDVEVLLALNQLHLHLTECLLHVFQSLVGFSLVIAG
jgi:hypothetical protein